MSVEPESAGDAQTRRIAISTGLRRNERLGRPLLVRRVKHRFLRAILRLRIPTPTIMVLSTARYGQRRRLRNSRRVSLILYSRTNAIC